MGNKENFFTSKIFLTMCSFIVGCVVMFCLIYYNSTNKLVKNVTNENIKTTTVEEVSDLKKAINNIYEATVYIENYNKLGNEFVGSGFIYKKDDNNGYILTNYHVIEKGKEYTIIFSDGSETRASLVGGDEYYDIAILKISTDKVRKIATLGDSSKIELGDTVFTVGSPLGRNYMGTITKGIVSGISRVVSVKLSSGSYLMEVIQTDASINSGNSGGPLCNIKGEVIGITSSKLQGNGIEGMGFAIPINTVKELIDGMEKGIKIERPYIGAQFIDISNKIILRYNNIEIGNNIEYGIAIKSVEDNMPAAKAGLKSGDVIVEADGKKIEDITYFKYLLHKHKIGEKMKVKYYRGNKLNETTIELTKGIKSE